MNILLNRLLDIINNENPNTTKYYIVHVFLSNLHNLGNLSVNEVAAMCCVSKSTISKFVREIGFDDYLDFRLSARAAVTEVEYNLGKSITDYIGQYGWMNYLDILQNDLKELKRTLDLRKIEELAEDLTKYEKAAAFGTVYSETAAIDLQYKLAFCNKIIHTNSNDQKQEEYIRNAEEDTLIIIFTNSGRYIKEYQLMEGYPEKDIFNETRAKIVVITSNKELEKDERVNLCICFNYTSEVQTHPMIFQVITDVIADAYKKRIK